MAQVRLSCRAVEGLDRLPNATARRIANALDRPGRDPQSPGIDVKPLVGRRPWRRLRVGDYRVLFFLSDEGRVVLVGRIIDRKELEQAVKTLPG